MLGARGRLRRGRCAAAYLAALRFLSSTTSKDVRPCRVDITYACFYSPHSLHNRQHAEVVPSQKRRKQPWLRDDTTRTRQRVQVRIHETSYVRAHVLTRLLQLRLYSCRLVHVVVALSPSTSPTSVPSGVSEHVALSKAGSTGRRRPEATRGVRANVFWSQVRSFLPIPAQHRIVPSIFLYYQP